MSKKTVSMVLTVILISRLFPLYAQTSLENNQMLLPSKIESDQKQNMPLSVQEDFQNQLGLIYSVKKIEDASGLIKAGNIQEAEKLLLISKDWLTEATDYHYALSQALSKQLKTAFASKIEKAHTLDFAQTRDQCYFLLSKVYIIQGKLQEAIKLLVDIVKSQPDSQIGLEAYKLLQEIKFSDKPKDK